MSPATAALEPCRLPDAAARARLNSETRGERAAGCRSIQLARPLLPAGMPSAKTAPPAARRLRRHLPPAAARCQRPPRTSSPGPTGGPALLPHPPCPAPSTTRERRLWKRAVPRSRGSAAAGRCGCLAAAPGRWRSGGQRRAGGARCWPGGSEQARVAVLNALPAACTCDVRQLVLWPHTVVRLRVQPGQPAPPLSPPTHTP
jgi:hypothetical protein